MSTSGSPEPGLPWWSPTFGEREIELVSEVVRSGYVNDGECTRRFERRVAEVVGCRHAVAVTSGTAALFAAFKALGIGPGDEVLVPDITFIATANAATWAGADVKLVDVEPHRFTLDPEAVERAIGPRTKAIVPVHISGRGANMPRLREIAEQHGLAIVEDAAEALGSEHEGDHLGTTGHAGVYSLSPNKIITTGQGGIVVTNDDDLHTRLRELKDQGRAVQGTGGDDQHPVVGYNLKLTSLQAALGLAQLERLDERLRRQLDTLEIYRRELDGIPGIRLGDFGPGEVPLWVDAVADDRDALDARLAAAGIACRRFWHPLHTQAPYAADADLFPVATRLGRTALWLPTAFTLTDEDVLRVCDHVRTFATEARAA